MASSSRSQVQTRTASAAASLAWERPSLGVRWRPPLTVAIVIHVVTESFVRARMACWPGSRYMTIFESYAPGMATQI